MFRGHPIFVSIDRTMESEKLINQLITQTQVIIAKAESLKSVDMGDLQWRQNDGSWNILECLEHLNLYGDFYVQEIEARIKSSNTQSQDYFKSGWLGGYFSRSMLPKGKLNKMSTFKDKDTLQMNLDKTVIDRFLYQQHKLLELLELAKSVSLSKVKTNITIPIIKLKLGDTLQFYINHMRRHMRQIERVEEERTK